MPPGVSSSVTLQAYIFKSSRLVRGQYLDGWPLNRSLAGAPNRWAGGWPLRVGVRHRNIDYKDQVSEGMTDCIGRGLPRFPCALVRMRYSGGSKAAAATNFTRDIVVVKRICERVAKWHQKSQSRKIYTGQESVYLFRICAMRQSRALLNLFAC